MRQIKFRGKTLKTGLWIYGDLVHAHSTAHISCSYYNNDGSFEVYPFEVDPKTVGQYTGAVDKNGKEIYEGDIIEYYAFEPVQTVHMVVEFSECAMSYPSMLSVSEYVEVIGNIFDNPDLAPKDDE